MTREEIIELLQLEYHYTYEQAVKYLEEWEEVFEKEQKEQEVKI